MDQYSHLLTIIRCEAGWAPRKLFQYGYKCHLYAPNLIPLWLIYHGLRCSRACARSGRAKRWTRRSVMPCGKCCGTSCASASVMSGLDARGVAGKGAATVTPSPLSGPASSTDQQISPRGSAPAIRSPKAENGPLELNQGASMSWRGLGIFSICSLERGTFGIKPVVSIF